MNSRTASLYARYAAALLALTLAGGVYLRASFAWPAVRGGMSTPYMIHAHSHAGFFGWMVMAAAAAILLRLAVPGAVATRSGGASPGAVATRNGGASPGAVAQSPGGTGGASRYLHTVLAHAIGVGSFAAFVGFALRGYDMVTITLSALHVVLWIVLVTALWRPVGSMLRSDVRAFLHAGLVFLVVAGLATLAPGLMMVRAVRDPWLLELGVKLFLTPFVSGFLLLTALGLLAGHLPAVRRATWALALIAVGTVPSTLLYVSATAPASWLVWPGRAGIGLVGAGLLVFAGEAVSAVLRELRSRSARTVAARTVAARTVAARTVAARSVMARLTASERPQPPLPPLALIAVAAAICVGAIKLLAAAGVGATFMHNRSITVAVLHLILLGLVTPALVLGVRPGLRAPVRSMAYAAGLALMLAPLAVTGWPWAARWVVRQGVSFDALFTASALGGVACAVALVALTVAAGTEAAEPAGAEAAEPAGTEAAEPAGAEVEAAGPSRCSPESVPV